LPFVPAILLLLLWQGFVATDVQRAFLFGSPLLILQVALEELPHLSIWRDIGFTLSAMLSGLFLGTFIGTTVGLILSINPFLRTLFKPYVAFLASIQIFTIAPLLVIWFGIGWSAKVAMATLATCFIALHQVASGIDAAEDRYFTYAESLQAHPLRVLRHITLPAAMHWILSGLKLNISFAALGALIGEFISAEQGLGHYIFRASSLYDVPRVWFGVILLSLIVVSLTSLADRISKYLTSP
jgi:NitT/TauT family transport system permease protein